MAHGRHITSVLLIDNKENKPFWRSFFSLEVQVQLPDRHDVSWCESMQLLIKSGFPRSSSRARLLIRWGVQGRAPKKIFLMLLTLFCIRTSASSAQTNPSTGSVRGILLLVGSDGPAYAVVSFLAVALERHLLSSSDQSSSCRSGRDTPTRNAQICFCFSAGTPSSLSAAVFSPMLSSFLHCST